MKLPGRYSIGLFPNGVPNSVKEKQEKARQIFEEADIDLDWYPPVVLDLCAHCKHLVMENNKFVKKCGRPGPHVHAPEGSWKKACGMFSSRNDRRNEMKEKDIRYYIIDLEEEVCVFCIKIHFCEED